MMDLAQMIEDYCRRASGAYTAEEVAAVIRHNRLIVGENGFVAFAWVLDEFHALFAYAAPGKPFKPIQDELEALARANGVRSIQFATDRPEIMGRLFRGYKPTQTILEKRFD